MRDRSRLNQTFGDNVRESRCLGGRRRNCVAQWIELFNIRDVEFVGQVAPDILVKVMTYGGFLLFEQGKVVVGWGFYESPRPRIGS